MEFQDFKAAVIKALSPSIGDEAGRFSTETATSENDETRMRETYSQSSDDPSMATTHVDTRHQESTASEAPAMSNTTPPRSVASHTQSSAPEPMSSSLQQVLADRRRRLEADKPAKDAAEKEKRQAAAKAQREDASARQGIPASRQLSYAQEQRKRQLEAKEERLRILKAIENDKAERKEKEAQRRVLVETELAEAENAEKASKSSNERIPKIWGAAAHVQQCSLQIRLFDGSTIRGKFEPQYTLNKDVRLWLAKQRTDGDTPYTLKQILTPQMNRTLSISEEEESLQSLGLLPSATLVMVPIKGYTNMYANDQGMVSKVWSLGYAVASAGGSLLRGTLGAVLGFGRAAQDTWETESQGDLDQTSFDNKRQKATAASGQEGIKYRTVDQQRDEREHHELYNGNQVRKSSLIF
ncbi:MAG: hypothetical protein L6R41_005824 [Letrouitia leprolyta]|nr:MAG: hypothetical protein L6R41_005824 [Letrouitia leprolyta]